VTAGKRVSWVELYLDLIFVVAIGQLAGTRVFLVASSRIPGVVGALLLLATFQLARLEPVLSPYGYLWLLAGWVAMCAALSTWRSGDDVPMLERYYGRRARRRGTPGRVRGRGGRGRGG
jgi:hypothetical protein